MQSGFMLVESSQTPCFIKEMGRLAQQHHLNLPSNVCRQTLKKRTYMHMTLYNSPNPLASLHKNTGSHRFNSIILNTFLQRFKSSTTFHFWNLVHSTSPWGQNGKKQNRGFEFSVNSNTSTPGTLTCTVTLSDVRIGTLKKYWKFMTAVAPGKPDKLAMIGLQTADSSNEMYFTEYTRVIRLIQLEELTRNMERGHNQWPRECLLKQEHPESAN